MDLDFSDYFSINNIESWMFPEEDIERADSYTVEEDGDYVYLTLYDEAGDFISEIEFGTNEIHTLQAYIDEFFDISYEDTYYSDVWDRTAKITDIQRDEWVYKNNSDVSVISMPLDTSDIGD